jgi:hypothetical protein
MEALKILIIIDPKLRVPIFFNLASHIIDCLDEEKIKIEEIEEMSSIEPPDLSMLVKADLIFLLWEYQTASVTTFRMLSNMDGCPEKMITIGPENSDIITMLDLLKLHYVLREKLAVKS